jgi:hypothetical protein
MPPRGSLVPAASAADAMHLVDFPSLGGLGAQALCEDGGDLAPKPPRRVKKIKFSLQPELDAAEPNAGE